MMETLYPLEEASCGWFGSPRISFSQDFDIIDRSTPEKRRRELVDDEGDDDDFSFEFSQSMSLDLPPENGMLSAAELFSNGKLRPLEKSSQSDQGAEQSLHTASERILFSAKNEETDRFGLEPLPMVRHLKSFNDNPRCVSMTMVGSRGHPQRSCISLNNSRCSSPSRTFSLPPTTPASPKASSSKYSSKFKDFFRRKRFHIPTSKEVPASAAVAASFNLSSLTSTSMSTSSSSSSTSSSAVVSRENSVSSSCRLPLPSRSFWPFSRSNSAGESKSGPKVSPPPRRSNSAGESKTSSSSLLPPKGNATENETKGDNSTSNQPPKKGLPPLPNPSVRKGPGTHPAGVPAHRDADAVTLSSSQATQLPSSSSSVPMSTSDAVSCSKPVSKQLDAGPPGVSPVGGDHLAKLDARCSSSPGRPIRRGPNSNGARNFSRGSPSRRASWSSPGRGPTRNYERGNIGPRGPLVRPKDMLSRDTASVRITPVLNVPTCITPSLRGTKVASKPKLFGLGNIFSKKDKVAGSYTILPPPDSQNGA